MNQNKHNLKRDINLLIQNIDTTSERLPSDNIPGIFLINNLTEKRFVKPYQKEVDNKNKEEKCQGNLNGLISKTMRNTLKNYNSVIKEYYSSQKETEEMNNKKSNIKSINNTYKKTLNKQKSENYQSLIKKINMVSSGNSKQKNYKKKIPYVQKKKYFKNGR